MKLAMRALASARAAEGGGAAAPPDDGVVVDIVYSHRRGGQGERRDFLAENPELAARVNAALASVSYLPSGDYNDRTCIIVIQVASPSGQPLLMGAIVDAVEEVIQLTDAEIEPAPDFGTGTGPGFITGMTTIQGGVKILLNIDKVFLEEGTIAIAAHLVQ
jgi:hypothetical protein